MKVLPADVGTVPYHELHECVPGIEMSCCKRLKVLAILAAQVVSEPVRKHTCGL